MVHRNPRDSNSDERTPGSCDQNCIDTVLKIVHRNPQDSDIDETALCFSINIAYVLRYRSSTLTPVLRWCTSIHRTTTAIKEHLVLVLIIFTW